MSDNPEEVHFRSLLAKQFRFDEKKLPHGLPIPRGVARNEQFNLGEPLLRKEPEYKLSNLQYRITSIANYYDYHCNEKNELNNQIKNILLESVRNSRNKPDDAAILYLEKKIKDVREILDQHNDKGFIWKKINLIKPNPQKYAMEVKSVLQVHLRRNQILSETQKTSINNTMDQLDAIVIADPKEKDPIQQCRDVRRLLNQLKTELQPEDDYQRLKLPALVKDLNLLVNSHHGENEVSEKIIESLNQYCKKNIFWSSVKQIFSFFKIPYSNTNFGDKNTIAEDLRNKLSILTKEGKGNDADAIWETLGLAKKQLTNFYSSSRFKLACLSGKCM